MPDPDTIRVLVVDDDPFIIRLLERNLADSHFDVLCASNGVEALQIIRSEGPSIVITDWLMPEMDGLELCRAIRTQEGISFTYVMVITGHPDMNSIVHAFDAGADDYLPKPFAKVELIARLRAGERIVKLQNDLVREQRLVHRTNAEMEVTHIKLADANRKLHTMATVDELTGMTNRREALRHLANFWSLSLENDTPLSCVLLDIDHFKNVNDTFGHNAGDDILRITAEAMRAAALATEIVCRMGGEEFLLLCPNATEAQAAQSGERMREAVEALRYRAGDTEIRVTISGGVAARTASCERPDDMIQVADGAMYAAKDAGRNQIRLAGQLDEDAATSTNHDITPRKTTAPPTPKRAAPEKARSSW